MATDLDVCNCTGCSWSPLGGNNGEPPRFMPLRLKMGDASRFMSRLKGVDNLRNLLTGSS